MEAYRTYATLDLKGNAESKMRSFSIATSKADKNVKMLTKSLLSLNRAILANSSYLSKNIPLISRFSNAFSSGEIKLKKFKTTTQSTLVPTIKLAESSQILSKQLNTVATGGERAAYSISKLNRATAKASAIQSGNAAAASQGAIISSAAQKGRAGHHDQMRLMRSSANSLGGRALSHPAEMMGAAGLVGGAPLVAGAGTAYLLHGGWEKSKEYEQVILQLKAQGFNEKQIAEARRLSQVATPGVSPLARIRALRDAQMGTRSWEEAKKLAPRLAQAEYVASSAFGGWTENQAKDLMRFAELMAGGKREKIEQWLDVGIRMMSTSGGTVMPSQQRTFAGQVGGALGNMSPLAYLGLEPVIQEMGGARAATGLVTGITSLLAGQGTGGAKYRVEDLVSLGIWEPQKMDKMGRPLGSKRGSMKKEYQDLLTTDPFLFMKDVVLPAYAKHGTVGDSEIQKRMMYDFSRTFANEMYIMYKNREKIELSRQLSKGALGSGALMGESLSTFSGSSLRLSSAWESFATALGKATSEPIMKGMNVISGFLEHLANLMGYVQNKEYGKIFDLSKMYGKSALDKGLLNMMWNVSPAHFALEKTGLLEADFAKGISSLFEKKSQPTNSVGDVYLDSRKVGTIMMRSITDILNRGGTITSQTGINNSLTPQPIGITSFGDV